MLFFTHLRYKSFTAIKASKRTVPVKVKAKESRTLMLKVLKLRNQVLANLNP